VANTFVNIGKIARMALATLYEQTIMAQLVHRDYEAELGAKFGDTITIRKPASFTANVFDPVSGIVIQDATETSTSMTMNRIYDVSWELTDKDATLNMDDIRDRIIAPATEAIAQRIDRDLIALALSTGVTQAYGTDGTPSTNPTDLVQLAKILNDALVPAQGRFTVLTNTVGANYSSNSLMIAVEQRGDTEGIREASLGRKFGFDNHQSTNFPAGAITDVNMITGAGGPTVAAGAVGDSFAMHRNAIAFASRSLEKPDGLPSELVSVQSYKGLSIRLVKGYNQTLKKSVYSLDLLCGAKLLRPDHIVRLRG
jgi:hypothetical protein